MTDPIREAAIEAAARAMADDWNPDRDPILTAMFRDYAQSAVDAALPVARPAYRAEALRDIEAVQNTRVGHPGATAWKSLHAALAAAEPTHGTDSNATEPTTETEAE